MSQSIVNEVLAKKPKRRVEWVQKRLKEDLAITHRDSLYEVLMRKEGRAFAADISGADAVRTYNAVLAAIDLFTTKQQRHLQADTCLLRKIHSQEQERHKAAQAKAKAAVKRPVKDTPSASGLVQRPQKEGPKMAQKSHLQTSSSTAPNSVSKEKPRSESPDWIPRTPPQAPPQEPRKTTGSWTTIFQTPPEEKLSPARTGAVSSGHQGADPKQANGSNAEAGQDSSSSTEYDAFATGPEPVALSSPSRKHRKRSHENERFAENATESPKEASARPSGLAQDKPTGRRGSSSSSSSSERKPAIKKEGESVPHPDGDAPSSTKTRSENGTSFAQGSDAASRTLEKSPEVNEGKSESLRPESHASCSDSDSSEAGAMEDGSTALPNENDNEGSELDSEGSNENEDLQVESIPDGIVAGVAPDPPAPLPRRQPPPPPPPRRRMAEAEALPHWRYLAPDGKERLAIRSSPGVDAPTTGGSLGSGEVFAVNQESPGANGVLFLRLADGRGWVFDRKSGLARRRKARPLCVPYQVPLVDEEDLGKAKRQRPKAVAHPKAKRRRRRQALIDPYMVTADIIQVDSDEEAQTAKASEDGIGSLRKEAKENLRVQLEKKQLEVQALREKLTQLDAQQESGSRLQRFAPLDPKQVPGGRWQGAEATDHLPDQKRRELQAMLAKKRALSGLQKTTPRYVD